MVVMVIMVVVIVMVAIVVIGYFQHSHVYSFTYIFFFLPVKKHDNDTIKTESSNEMRNMMSPHPTPNRSITADLTILQVFCAGLLQ